MPQVVGTVTEDSGSVMTNYSDTVTNSVQTFTFATQQDGMAFINRGNALVTLTVNGKSNNVPPNGTIRLNGEFTSFDVTRIQTGSHPFEINSFRLKNDPRDVEGFASQIAESATNVNDLKKKQTNAELYGLFLNKTIKKQPFKIVCLGDSMTYGYDINSTDRRAWNTDPTMDPARAQNTDIAGKTYPEALRDYLRESFGMTTIDVVNRGYSGEDSRGVQTRWTTNPNADLHIIMLGSNDATRSIPVDEYLSNMYKLVNNIISWGSAVILLTPPKHSTETSVDISLKSMAEGLYALGKVLGVPVINSKRFLEGIPYLEHHPVSGSTLLDAIHYNSYGYSVFASKVAALIVGRVNLFDVKHLTPGNHLFVDKSRYGFTQSGADNTTQLYSSISPIGIADSNAKGIYANVTPGNSLTYSFYAEENDLVLVPIHQFAQTTNASVEYSLNYGLKQARPLNSGVDNNQTQANATDITPTITFTNHQNLASGNPYLLSKQLIGSKLLRVTQKGWHTLIIRNTSTNVNAHCYILGTEVLSLRSLKNYDVAAPTTGTWVKGSIVWNSNPVAAPASPIGWVCTSSGTPGTWYQFGLVGATRMTKQVNSAATDVPTLQADFNALLDKLKAGGWMDA